jgi:hypothetical protein
MLASLRITHTACSHPTSPASDMQLNDMVPLHSQSHISDDERSEAPGKIRTKHEIMSDTIKYIKELQQKASRFTAEKRLPAAGMQ